MDGLLARLKLGSKKKKKTTASVKRTRPESARQQRDTTSGSLYSDLTASSSTVSAASAPDTVIVLKKDQAGQVEEQKQQVVEKKSETVVEGRNLLNKKEQGPPSTIKESSESSQTIDDNDSEKGGGQLKHENTVVRADGATGIVSSSNSSTASKSSSTNLSAQKQEIVRVTQTLLDAISCKDFDTYTRLCDTSMTCFEPEALGNLIEGIEFHRFYFDGNRKNQVHTTMLNPNVHIIGEDAACVAYVKLTQFLDRNGEAHTRQSQESRVWSKKQGRWVCVHVHRSTQPSTNTTASEF
uniref:CaMKII_AD domain-containing protein n=1 Tax=Caenorhabditis tropicalis TaxID=1561998 RepID=A0A1I7UND2_9PELO